MMLIKFSRELAGNKTSNNLIFLFLTFNFIIIFGLGYIITTYLNQKPLTLVKYYYAGFNFLYSSIAAAIIVSNLKKSRSLNTRDRSLIGLVMVLIMAIHGIALVFFEGQAWLALLFIFIFFSGNTFLPLYLSYVAVFTAFSDKLIEDISFDEFYKRFEVSPRESEIIREICNGLSNKEISDKLFISIQTVKDHTHRIYIKTNVRSRAQLMNLARVINGMKP
jgi:DNA-binding CsgD family transcriptional regulator